MRVAAKQKTLAIAKLSVQNYLSGREWPKFEGSG